MQAQCVICDKVEQLNENSLEAKKLLNRKSHTYLCSKCSERIAHNTKKRHETGKFQLNRGLTNSERG